jgi:hypothetical protein
VVTRSPKLLLTPVYGFFCGGQYGNDIDGHDQVNRSGSPVSGDGLDKVCYNHDKNYVNLHTGNLAPGDFSTRKGADLAFFRRGIIAGTNGHFLTDRLMRVNVGLMNRFAAVTFIGVQGAAR